MQELAKLDGATRALAEAKSLQEVAQIRDIAEAARTYARAAKLGLEAQNHAAEIKLRAERKAGELLSELERGKGNRFTVEDPSVGSSTSEYKQVITENEIPHSTAHRWQQVAAIPKPVFEEVIKEVKEAKEELSTAGTLRAASRKITTATERVTITDKPVGWVPDVATKRSDSKLKTFFRYPGGKGKMAGILVEELRSMAKVGDEYREPFVGGGGVFLPVLSDGAFQRYWINDFDYGIYCIWLSVKSFYGELVEQILSFTPTVESFYAYRDTLSKDCRHISPPEVAFMKIAVHQMSYSGLGTRAGGPIGGVNQSSEYDVGCRWNGQTITNKMSTVHSAMRNVDVVVTNLDYRAMLYGENAVMYLDPPYYEQGSALYQCSFDDVQHRELADKLKSTRFPWLLSYDKCDDVRGMYAWANLRETEEIHYSINMRNGNQSRFAAEYLITGGAA